MSRETIDDGALLRVPKNVLFEDLEGEAILLDLDSGVYYGLDPVGTRAWLLIAEHGRLDAARKAMLSEYDVDERRLAGDLAALAAELLAKGLLEEAS